MTSLSCFWDLHVLLDFREKHRDLKSSRDVSRKHTTGGDDFSQSRLESCEISNGLDSRDVLREERALVEMLLYVCRFRWQTYFFRIPNEIEQ